MVHVADPETGSVSKFCVYADPRVVRLTPPAALVEGHGNHTVRTNSKTVSNGNNALDTRLELCLSLNATNCCSVPLRDKRRGLLDWGDFMLVLLGKL